MWNIMAVVIRGIVDNATHLGTLDEDGKVDFLGDLVVKFLDDKIQLKPGLEQMSDIMIKAIVEFIVEPEIRKVVQKTWGDATV